MDLAELLAEIDRLKGEIDNLRPIDAVLEQKIMQKFRLDWNYHSNAIEGNSLSLGETRAFLLHGLTAKGKPFKDYLDIKGHNESIQYLEDMVRKRPTMTEAMIRELHKILLVEPYKVKAKTADGLPTSRMIQIGEYKASPNHVKTKTGEIFYFAEPAAVPAEMNELVKWVRETEEAGEVHSLIIATTLHYRFVRIHPFDDGNGRMARLLMNLILMRAGFPPVVIRLEDKEGEYFPALTEADADGNLEPLILFVGKELLRSEEMFLSGAKGEDIATNGDFEKKIALLQQRIESRNVAKEQGLNSARTQAENALSNFVFPFILSLVESTSQLGKFFESFDVFVQVDNVRTKIENHQNIIEEMSQNQSGYFRDLGFDFQIEFILQGFAVEQLSTNIITQVRFVREMLLIKIAGELKGTSIKVDMTDMSLFDDSIKLEKKFYLSNDDVGSQLNQLCLDYQYLFFEKLDNYMKYNE